MLRRVAVGGLTVRLDGHLPYHRQLRGIPAPRNGLADLLQVAEGLEDKEVCPPLGERRRLIAEGLPRLLPRRRPVRLEAKTDRSDASGYEQLVARHLASELGRRRIDRLDRSLEAVASEPEAVGAEGVRLEHVRSRLPVLLVDLTD